MAGGYKGLKNIMKVGEALVHTTPDGSKTLVKYPMQRASKFSNSDGNSLQLASEIALGGPKELKTGSTPFSNQDLIKLRLQQSDEATNVLPSVTETVQASPPTSDDAIKKAALAALPTMALGGSAMNPLKDGFNSLKDAFGVYRDNVVEPTANALKERLTPNINVRNQSYSTASPVSDAIIDTAVENPLDYVGGGAGVVLGALDAATSLTEEENKPKRSFDSLRDILNKKK